MNRFESPILLFEQIHQQGLHFGVTGVQMTGTQITGNLVYTPASIEALLTFVAEAGETNRLYHQLYESEFQRRINHPNSNERHNDMHHFVLFTITDLKKSVGIEAPGTLQQCFTGTGFQCTHDWTELLKQHAGEYAEGLQTMMAKFFAEKQKTSAPTTPGSNPHEVPDLWDFFYGFFGLFRIPRPNKKRYDDLDQPGLLECLINAILDKIEAIAKTSGMKEALRQGSILTADTLHDMEHGPPRTFSSLITP